jgi:hypothetical protein
VEVVPAQRPAVEGVGDRVDRERDRLVQALVVLGQRGAEQRLELRVALRQQAGRERGGLVGGQDRRRGACVVERDRRAVGERLLELDRLGPRRDRCRRCAGRRVLHRPAAQDAERRGLALREALRGDALRQRAHPANGASMGASGTEPSGGSTAATFRIPAIIP